MNSPDGDNAAHTNAAYQIPHNNASKESLIEQIPMEEEMENIEYDSIDEAELLRIDETETHNNAQTTSDYIYNDNHEQNGNNNADNDNILYDMTDLNDSIIEADHNAPHELTTADNQTTTKNEYRDDNGIEIDEPHILNLAYATLPYNNTNINDGASTSTSNQFYDNDINNGASTSTTYEPYETDNTNFNEIPTNLLPSFRSLYSLKLKQTTQQATLDKLNEYHNTNTTPPGLTIKHKCRLQLPPTLRERWERTLTNASNELLQIVREHHTGSLLNINTKIQQSTQHVITNSPNPQLTNHIIEQSNIVGESYSRRTIINKIKATKRLKKQHNTDQQPSMRNKKQTNKKQTNKKQTNNNYHTTTKCTNNTQLGQQPQPMTNITPTPITNQHNQNSTITVTPTNHKNNTTRNFNTTRQFTQSIPTNTPPTPQRLHNTTPPTPVTIPPTPVATPQTPRLFQTNQFSHNTPTMTNRFQHSLTQHIEQGIQDFLRNKYHKNKR